MSSALLVLANLVAPSPALLPVLPSPASVGRLGAAAAAELTLTCAFAPGSSQPATSLTPQSADGFTSARAAVRASNGLKVSKQSSVGCTWG